MTEIESSSEKPQPRIVGGGIKKIMYALSTARRIGLKSSAKALSANNTCKACGLGMGGQKGGMTNELGEYPAVCNKSIQAQSTDIQPPIPAEIFQYTLNDLNELSGHEIEHLGRLGNPVFKAKDDNRYQEVEWQWALQYAAEKFANSDPARSFFYSSGRSSNEAGFVLQLLARLYGTNNINNCSYYCHQATSVGLGNSIGSGTATVELDDLTGCDLIFVIGANPASNHPRFVHKLKACRERGGEVIVINPAKESGLVRFAVPKSARSMLSGGTWIASDYLQPRIGSDTDLFKGIAKALLASNSLDSDFINKHTTGFEAFAADLQQTDWDGIVSRTGISKESIERVALRYSRAKNTVFSWGMGLTHHANGVENIEGLANLALMRGMVGKPCAGLLPLRGHSNVQGIGTMGVKPVLAEDVFKQIESEFGVKLPTAPGLDTMASLEAAAEGTIDNALLMGGNLYGASPNSRWTKQALNSIPFKLFLTTTLNYGHVNGVDQGESLVLPVTARDEEPQPTTQESMFNFVRMSDGGIERLENVRSEVEVLCQLGKRILPESLIDFERLGQHKTIREAIAHTVPGMEALANIDIAKKEFHVAGRLLHEPRFTTGDGRAHFRVHGHSANVESGLALDYPFRLMTVRSEGQFNTIVYEENDSYRNIPQRWSVLLNPEDMREMALEVGDTVDLKSQYGEMRSVAVYPYDIVKGNAMAYFPEANILTGNQVDPRSRTPAFKSIAIAISAQH